MELHADEERMVFEFDDLHSLTLFIATDEVESRITQFLDVFRVDFVSVAMAFVHAVLVVVELPKLRPGAILLKQCGAETKSHVASHGRLVDFRHEYHNWVRCVGVEFYGGGGFQTADAACVFDHGELHAQTDSEVGFGFCACPVCCGDHTLCAALAEAAGYEHTVGGAEFVPGLVVLFGGGVEGGLFEVGSVDPDEVEFALACHGGVFEGFDDADVAVAKVGVFADEGDGDFFVLEETFLACRESFPVVPDGLALDYERGFDGVGVEAEEGGELWEEGLLFEKEGDMVGRFDIVNGDDLGGLDLAEHGDFGGGGFYEGFLTSAGNLNIAVNGWSPERRE